MSKKGIKIVKLSQASSLAKIISNKTAQQIIEFIGSSKKATATQITTSLDIPASTVHYNMKALVKGGIVDDSQFTYSSKGKTIIHYQLTNNILVIIPESQDQFSVLNSIKALVPSFIGLGLFGVGWSLFSTSNSLQSSSSTLLQEQIAAPMATNFAADSIVKESAPALAKSAPLLLTPTAHVGISEFIWGLIVAALIFGVIFIVRNHLLLRKKNK